jgi:hypothetical protein
MFPENTNKTIVIQMITTITKRIFTKKNPPKPRDDGSSGQKAGTLMANAHGTGHQEFLVVPTPY